MESFYLFLPSNVKDITGKNTIGNYTTILPQEIKLYDEGWEVGLAEIQITKTWFNIRESQEISLQLEDDEQIYQMKLPPGCYADIYDIMNEIQIRVMKIFEKMYFEKKLSPKDVITPVLQAGKNSRVVILPGKIGQKIVNIIMSDELTRMIGFVDDSVDETIVVVNDKVKSIKGKYTSKRKYDLNNNLNNLFLYCDVVKSSVVGDTQAQLLRIITIPVADFYSNIIRIYENPQYFPVLKSEFNTIEIDLKDDTGETLKFESGRVIAVLHFRKKLK